MLHVVKNKAHVYYSPLPELMSRPCPNRENISMRRLEAVHKLLNIIIKEISIQGEVQLNEVTPIK